MGRILCIANQKGGVGKTTTAVNLAAALALDGQATLLLDLDPQGSASSGVGVSSGDGRPTTYDILLGGVDARTARRASQIAGLEVIPAGRDLVGAEIELVPTLAREHRLSQALAGLRADFAYILIDCPPSLGLLTLNALTAADAVLVPLQCEYYALEGLTALLDTVQLVRDRLNPQLRLEGVVLTMFDGRNALSHQVAAEVRQHFPREVFDTTIPRNVRLSEAPSHGIPAVLYDPTSKGAQAYRALAVEVVERDAGGGAPAATGEKRDDGQQER